MAKRQIVQSGTAYMRDVLEAQIMKHPKWWVLVKNTSQMYDGTTRQIQTRIYQLTIYDRPTDFGIKFFYDYRNGEAQAVFDVVALRVIEHQSKEDFDIAKIDAYIKSFVEKHKPTKPWWHYL
jgi:hypothetical protein